MDNNLSFNRSGSPGFILIACLDTVVLPEATHAAAATQCEVKTATDPRDIVRLAPAAEAIIVDAHTAAHVAGTGRRQRIFFVEAEPGPINYEQALNAHAEQAFILPAQTTELLEALARPATQPPASGIVLGVAGVCGGVGTSVLAAAVARRAASWGSTLLIDADPNSGGMDLVMGIEHIPGARWPDLAESTRGGGAIAAADLSAALPATTDGISVLSAARSAIADPFSLKPHHVSGLLGSLTGNRGITIVDLGTGFACEDIACGHVIVMCAAEVKAVAAATQLCARLAAHATKVSVVLRHRGWSAVAASDVEKLTKAEVIAELPTIKGLAKDVEVSGLPHKLPRALRAVCDAVLDRTGV